MAEVAMLTIVVLSEPRVGSLNETKHFLRRAYRRKLLTERDVRDLKPLVDELGPKLNNFLRSIGRDTKPRTPLPTDN
jgi:hypothetical protein